MGWISLRVIAPFDPGVSQKSLSKRKLLELQKEKEIKSHKPDIGLASSEPGRGGRIGTSQSSLLTQHLIKKTKGIEDRTILRIDSRQANVNQVFLRHNGKKMP